MKEQDFKKVQLILELVAVILLLIVLVIIFTHRDTMIVCSDPCKACEELGYEIIREIIPTPS